MSVTIGALSECEFCTNVRIKRAKFYPGPIRYFRRPINFPKGFYSNTPPPNYLMADDEYMASPSRVHYTKKPNNNNLDEEEISDLFKNLSREDLNKILEMANEKEEVNNFNKISYNAPAQNSRILYKTPIQTNSQFNDANSINNIFTNMMSNRGFEASVLYTDSKIAKEEVLPKPVNLREGDYDISYTKHVPSYAKPNYKVENFGELPLEDNKSKLTSVSSYNVPHYSVCIYIYFNTYNLHPYYPHL